MKSRQHKPSAYLGLWVIGLACLVLPPLAQGATVTLVNDQASLTSNSWNTAADWSNTATPSALNDYVVDGSRILRTVNTSSADTFGGNSLTIESGSTIYLKGTAAHTITIGALRLNGGQVSHAGGANAVFTLAGGVTLGNSTTSNFNGGSAGRTITAAALITGSGNLTVSGNLVVFAANNNYTGSTTVNSGGTLQVGNGSTTGSISSSSSVITNGTLSYNHSNNHVVSYVISGTGGVSSLSTGSGKLIINSACDYTGVTAVGTGATLQIGDGGTTGSIANTSGVTNGGTLIYNRSDNLSVNYAISGTGTVTKLGAGTLTLNNTSNYSGGTSIGDNTSNVGIVNVTASNALGTGKATLISNSGNGNLAKLTLNSGSGITLSNDFDTSGTGPSNDLIDNQSGNNTLSGNFSLVGGGGSTAIKVSGGSLSLTGGITANVSTGRALILGGAANGSASGALANGSGALSLTKRDAGTWILTGTNTYTGTTAVDNGTLLINGNNSAATGAVTVAAGATLGGIGVVGGATTIDGFLAPGQSPGTLTFSGNLTLNNGATYLFEGGDLVDVGGTLTLTNNWTLALGANLQDGGSIVLFEYGALAATPDLIPTFDVSSLGFTPTGPLSITSGGGFVTLNGVSLIPEPSALLMACFGMAGLLCRRRR